MILSTAPWRRAIVALRRQPGLLVMTMAAGLIVGIVATASTFFVDAAGSGAVQTQWERSCPANIEPTIEWNVRGYGALGDLVDPIATDVGGFRPTEQILATDTYQIANGDVTAPFGLLIRDDFRNHIDVVDEGTEGVLWIPDTLATRIGASVGDEIAVGKDGALDTTAIVHGIYRDLTLTPFDHYWCAARDRLITPAITAEYVSPPRGLITRAQIAQFAELSGGAVDSFVPFAVEPTNLTEARRARDDTAELNRRLAIEGPAALDAVTDLGYEPSTPSTTSGIARLEKRATDVKAAVAAAIRPVALLAIGSGLALASVLGVMWVRVKRNDAVALATVGLSPAAIGSKASLETLLPLLVGAVSGTLVSRAALAVYAPATTLEPGTFARAVVYGMVAGVGAAVLVGTTAAMSCRNLLSNVAAVRRSKLASVPWELAFVAAAVLSWSGFRSGQLIAVSNARVAKGDVAGISTAALTFPLLVFVGGALVTARIWSIVLGGRRRRSVRFTLPRSLAHRRLRFQARSGAALVACGTIAIAISVYGAGLVTSLARTGDAKAGLFVGSDLSFRVGEDLPDDVPGATEVLRRMKATYAGVDVDLIAIDPTTFEGVAFWDDSFDDRPLHDVIDQLRTDADGIATVLAVGDLPAAGLLSNTQGRPGNLEVRVAETMQVFPGATTARPFLIMSSAQAAASEFKFIREVWARGTYEHWNARLIELGARPFFGIAAQDAIDSSTLLFSSWAFEFVRALGAFVGLQVVIALLLQIASRQRKQALGSGFLRRMGLRTRASWRALVLEVSAYAAAMLVVGVVLAVAAIRIVGPRLDPLPTSPPDPLLVLPRLGIGAAIGVAVATVIGGTLAAQSLGNRTNLAQALRDDD